MNFVIYTGQLVRFIYEIKVTMAWTCISGAEKRNTRQD
jgi:hypothetical protein